MGGALLFAAFAIIAFVVAGKTAKFVERFHEALGRWTLVVSSLLAIAVFCSIALAGVAGCLRVSIAVNGL